MRTRAVAAGLLGAAALLFVPACEDEDGDGGVTDEEIEDVEDTGEDVQREVEEEIDAQDEGSNEG